MTQTPTTLESTVAELDRLRAANKQLVEALDELNRECIAAAKRAGSEWPPKNNSPAKALSDKVQDALQQAREE